MKRLSYSAISERLVEAERWLVSLGVIVSGENRISRLILNVGRLAEAFGDGTLQELVDDGNQVELQWSLVEGLEFLEIFDGLRQMAPNRWKEKLVTALQGPIVPDEESADSNLGRNTMFELNVGGRLTQKGILVDLPQDNPDILCEINFRKIFLQCKRPFSERGLPQIIRRAGMQLKRDLAGEESALGIASISVSRVRNSGDRIFVVGNEREGRRLLADDVQRLAERYKRDWENLNSFHERIIGILFHIITPAHVRDVNLLVAAQQTVMCPFSAPGTEERELFGAFASAFLQPDEELEIN